MRIIPAIDIIEGKCVRLTKGDYDTKKVYNENPLEVAKQFEDNGIEYLHVVDLDGAKANEIVNYKILKELTSKTNLAIDFGGGIKHTRDLRTAFECGVQQVTIGSRAAQKPNMFLQWLKDYGPQQIILGADAKNRKIATMGWEQTSETDVVNYIQQYEEEGVEHVICTDISKDGMLQGPSFQLYGEILNQSSVQLIASGGISSMDDLKKLKEMGCSGAIIGKAIYEGTISLQELSELC